MWAICVQIFSNSATVWSATFSIFGLRSVFFLLHSPLQVLLILLPTGSEEREVLGVGSIPVAILPSCQYTKILHFNCTDMNMVG